MDIGDLKTILLIAFLIPCICIGAGVTTSSTNGVSSGLTLAGTTTNKGLISGGSISIATNFAAIPFTTNPLTSGAFYTNGSQRALLVVGAGFSGLGQEVWLTNLTSHQIRDLKSGVGVNQSASMLISPNDVVCFTNFNGTPVLLSSELDGL